MKIILLTFFAALTASCSTTMAQKPLTSASLIGTWNVSIRFDPDLPPSNTEMQITKVDNGALTGTFYGSEIEEGRITSLSTTLVIAGRTGDLTGAYWHSGRMQADGSIEGQTLSEGRDFLMTWRGVKK